MTTAETTLAELPSIQVTNELRNSNREQSNASWSDYWSLLIVLAGVITGLDCARRQSPTYDEILHVVSGLCYWQHGRFDVYPQNPPFVKLCLSAPLALSKVQIPNEWLGPRPAEVHVIGNLFHNRYRDEFDCLYFRCRVVSLLFYIWGAWQIGLWSQELYGTAARRGSMCLWCFHPLVLAHATVATPDMGTAVISLIVLRRFCMFLKSFSWTNAIMLGMWLGIGQASKFTLVLLYLVFPILLLIFAAVRGMSWRDMRSRVVGLMLSFLISLLPMTSAYGFQQLGVPLASNSFDSPSMRRIQTHAVGTPLAWGARLVSEYYLLGIDRQIADIDGRWVNFFRGHQSRTGWISYYPTALALKIPAPFWIVFLIAMTVRYRSRDTDADNTCLVGMPLLLFLFLWSNTSLTFLRYLLPCYPPMFVWIGRSFGDVVRRRYWLAIIFTATTCVATVSRHPNYLGYFNYICGGPAACWQVFSDGEIDWGQDFATLADWQQQHPDAMPMQLALFAPHSPPYHNLSDASPPPNWHEGLFNAVDQIPTRPQVGWLAISISLLNRGTAEGDLEQNRMTSRRPFLKWVIERKPIARIGTSIHVYQFTRDDIANWDETIHTR